MAVTGIGGGLPPQFPKFIPGLPQEMYRAPAPNERQVDALEKKAFDVAPIATDRPGGAPFHSGEPLVAPPKDPNSSSVVLTSRPVSSPIPLRSQNAVLEQAETNQTEMVGLLLDRFV